MFDSDSTTITTTTNNNNNNVICDKKHLDQANLSLLGS